MTNERRIKAFLDRGIYASEEEVIQAALKALAREQIAKEAKAERKARLKVAYEKYAAAIAALKVSEDFFEEEADWF